MARTHPLEHVEAIIVVGIGGFAGSNLRYFVELFVPGSMTATMSVNILGCFALGFLIYEEIFSGTISGPSRTLMATGFIASFTTYSTFIIDALTATPMIAIGAVVRYTVDQLLPHDRFPFSTLTVNVVGSFVLGLVVFAGVNSEITLFIGAGACGSFTTYSSFSVQTVRLWEAGDGLRAISYALGTLGLGLIAAGIGAGIATVLQSA